MLFWNSEKLIQRAVVGGAFERMTLLAALFTAGTFQEEKARSKNEGL